MLECTILGKHGPYPEPGGACSGYLIKKEDSFFLFDMGAGAFGRLMENIDPEIIEGIFISHWHGDHCSDLLVFDYYLSSLNNKTPTTIPLYGPIDDTSPVYNHVKSSPYFSFHQVKAGDEVTTSKGVVKVGPTGHPVPGVGYRIDGWVYSGDTNLVQGLEEFIREADLWLACGCVLSADWQEKGPHLSGEKAAELAQRAGVKSLVLTHLKPVVDGDSLLQEAKALFPESFLAEERKRYRL